MLFLQEMGRWRTRASSSLLCIANFFLRSSVFGAVLCYVDLNIPLSPRDSKVECNSLESSWCGIAACTDKAKTCVCGSSHHAEQARPISTATSSCPVSSLPPRALVHPLALAEAEDLFRLVFGEEAGPSCAQWSGQGLTLGRQDTHHAFVLVQRQGGPCGVLAPLQVRAPTQSISPCWISVCQCARHHLHRFPYMFTLQRDSIIMESKLLLT